ncbi:MAG: ABC transporter ATP-binding protein [Helicobacter sp.]|nr:ABC transporter ATP-binding protein [Helicobacter sp.]
MNGIKPMPTKNATSSTKVTKVTKTKTKIKEEATPKVAAAASNKGIKTVAVEKREAKKEETKEKPKKVMLSKEKKEEIPEIRKSTFFQNVSYILQLISMKDKFMLFGLLMGTFLLTFIETFGVSVIMPFITLATNPDLIFKHKIVTNIYEFTGMSSTVHFMILFAGLLVGFYLFRAFYSVAYSYMLNRFVSRKYHYFSYQIFCKTIKLDYENFSKRNLDLIRKEIVSESSNTASFLSSFLSIFAEVSVFVLLYIMLIFISWKMTLVLTAILFVNVLLIIKGIGSAVSKQGEERAKAEGSFFKILSQTLGNFKIVKLRANEEESFEVFARASKRRAKAGIMYSIFSSLPRNILETVGFSILVAAVGYVLWSYGNAGAVLPIISMYTLALYRILPSISRVLDNYNTMVFMGRSVVIVYDALKSDEIVDEGNDKIEFNKSIEVKNMSFNYPEKKNVFTNYSLKIKKGEKVAFVGRSGAGKSTLVDLIIGILKPKEGAIYVDGKKLDSTNIRSWRKRIGYIPQSIYLFDGTVAENIAFGGEICEDRLTKVTKMAKIYDFLAENEGFDTKVGDGGSQLSGGQKQRIGIARALYHDPDILVLDEATSALDNQTEAAIMDEIYQIAKDRTLLVIAHRLSTVERCDRRIEVNKKEAQDMAC